jgi:hypothetical protein
MEIGNQDAAGLVVERKRKETLSVSVLAKVTISRGEIS